MTEKKTAVTSSIIGIVILCCFAYYITTLNSGSKFGLSGSSSSVEYGVATALGEDNSNVLGANIEYKAGVVKYFENNQIEQSSTTSSNQ